MATETVAEFLLSGILRRLGLHAGVGVFAVYTNKRLRPELSAKYFHPYFILLVLCLSVYPLEYGSAPEHLAAFCTALLKTTFLLTFYVLAVAEALIIIVMMFIIFIIIIKHHNLCVCVLFPLLHSLSSYLSLSWCS